MTPFWISAFLDVAAPDHQAGLAFWSAVTGYDVSAPRGDDGEFATLVPPEGDDHLRVQRLAEGASRIHLDLHVTDPAAAADRAEGLGGVTVVLHDLGYVVMTSPAGITFCLVTHPAARRALPATWPDGGTSLVDQVCLDITPSAYDLECEFWQQLTGWELNQARLPQYRRLRGPATMPLRLLLQRLDDEGPSGAHLDLGATDRAAEVARHLTLGARPAWEGDVWTVLTDPTGSAYCVIERPETEMRA